MEDFKFEKLEKWEDQDQKSNEYKWLESSMDSEEIDFVENLLAKIGGAKND